MRSHSGAAAGGCLLGLELLELNQHLVDRHIDARHDVHGLDDGVLLGAQDVLHLHGFDHDELLAQRDLVAWLDQDRDHLAGHGRDERVTKVALLGHRHVRRQLALEHALDLDRVDGAHVLQAQRVVRARDALDHDLDAVDRSGEDRLLGLEGLVPVDVDLDQLVASMSSE